MEFEDVIYEAGDGIVVWAQEDPDNEPYYSIYAVRME